MAGKTKDSPLITGTARPSYPVAGLNAWDAALGRMRWLFDEFGDNLVVSNSGGKDSTVLLEIALIVARERNQLPLRVQWLDQECEFEATVEYQRYIASRPEIQFEWYQVPFKLFNATNHANPWLNVWGPGEEWVRPKDPGTIQDHDYHRKDGSKVDRFKELLSYINSAREGQAVLTGMRAEESPNRRLLMVSKPMYKWVTWCSIGGGDSHIGMHYRFHPLYDWSYRDIWKAIHEHGWKYNSMYDLQYQHGVGVRSMRVSNYHHVQALGALDYLQEAEPETWEAASRRLDGVNAQGHVGSWVPKTLPYMFTSWEEYAQYLIDHLAFPAHRPDFERMGRRLVKSLADLVPAELVWQKLAGAVVRNDYVGASLDAFETTTRKKRLTKPKGPTLVEEIEEAMT